MTSNWLVVTDLLISSTINRKSVSNNYDNQPLTYEENRKGSNILEAEIRVFRISY